MFFVESSENSHICPVCQGTLHYRDSRPRIRKKEGGTKEQLMIRRFRCQNCHAYHNELPDCLVPYKHYEAEVIAGVLDEVILPDDLDSEDYPSFSTMLRWLQWFRENLQRMEGYLRTAGYQILNLGEDFLFSSDCKYVIICTLPLKKTCRPSGGTFYFFFLVRNPSGNSFDHGKSRFRSSGFGKGPILRSSSNT